MYGEEKLNPSTDYTRFLRDQLESRIRLNAAYSLRSFARDVGVAASNLSLVLRNKKGLSTASAAGVALRLGLSDDEAALFCDLVALKHTRSPNARRIVELRLSQHTHKQSPANAEVKSRQLSLDAFRVISDWYHYALLELSLTKNFRSDPAWIAKRLGISIHEVNSAIERLRRLELITFKKNKLVKTDVRLLSSDGIASEAIRKFNRQILTKALEALSTQKIDERDFITMTVAANPKKITEARKIVRRFRNEITAKLEEGNATEVFCFSVQMFRLSQTKEKP